jgi:ATP adenylyltransferase
MDNHGSYRQVSGCPFCYENIKERIVLEFEDAVAIRDEFPVTEGHLLLIPKNHSANYFALAQKEKRDIDQLLIQLKESLTLKDRTITGFNIGVNCGESAGQTIFHTHIHLIPRRYGDTENPRGGVRGVIPGKMNY